ncbi:hypothetical protein PV327_004881 [Microctonus hyperodae]|uniref:THAP-type domain-containing protein n=1 Tax=Microctonus hyperodae TaxID=165561 RepID=A0AA39FDJ0_MICHY|nr:hypothetical protein PV327_004881 [Microctonus hyperodae]
MMDYLFEFPLNNSNRLEQWLNNFPLKNWQPSKDSLLCSDHFTEDCFDRTGFRVHLQPNSIPTKFGEARSLCAYCKRKKLYKSGLSFFRFPLDHPRILKRWLQNMGKEDWNPSSDSYLCSTHFESNCLRVVKEKYPILKKGSVPTIFNTNQIVTEDTMTRMESVNEEVDSDAIAIQNAVESIQENVIDTEFCDDINQTVDTNNFDEMREFINFESNKTNKENEAEKNGCILLEIDPSCNIDDSRIITGEDCIFSLNEEMEQTLSVPMDFETSIPEFIETNNTTQHKAGAMVEHDHSYMDPPTLAQKKLIECQKAVKKKDAIIKLQTRKLQRLEKKVMTLKEVVGELRQKLKIADKKLNYSQTPTG